MDTPVLHHLCIMFTLCIRFGVVPSSFGKGLLIPILKKPTLDPSVPKNYRPVTISSTLSKILELYMLDIVNCEDSELQFGFVPGRGTQMAAALANDVISYCTSRGSTVYSCSLDAKGAFDAIPHHVLFRKTMDSIPTHCWRMLVYWYGRLTVQVKWSCNLSKPINVCKGTRQGGLSSPLLFNLFYRDLGNMLSETAGGICINGLSFNVFCYADDLLVTSLTATGLQNLIHVANEYIISHGLRFNPAKTECTIFCQCYLQPRPQWSLNNIALNECDNIKYLGVNLSYIKPDTHSNTRIKACRNAYYALQGVGLCVNGSGVDTIAYVWNTAIGPVLTYGIQCGNMNKGTLQKKYKLNY